MTWDCHIELCPALNRMLVPLDFLLPGRIEMIGFGSAVLPHFGKRSRQPPSTNFNFGMAKRLEHVLFGTRRFAGLERHKRLVIHS
jgi:hypothetical protein